MHPQKDYCFPAAFQRQQPRFLVSCFSDEGITEGRSRPEVLHNTVLQGRLFAGNASFHLPVTADVTAQALHGDRDLSQTTAELIHH